MSIRFEFDALTIKDGAGSSSRRDLEFLMEPLECETPLPGVPFNVNVVNEAQLSKATRSPQTFSAGSPRLVDGARESNVVQGYQQSARDWGSDHAAMKTPVAQGSKGDPSTSRARSGKVYCSKTDGGISHSQCLEFLSTKGPSLLLGDFENKEETCNLLLNVADIVKVLPPANEPLSTWDVLNMTHWRATLSAFAQEMKIVADNFPSVIGNSGAVYVLTASPYPAFLRALAAEIADRRG